MMDSHLFRGGRWTIDLNDADANSHLRDVKFSGDTILLMKYLIFLLYESASNMGSNEFSERHEDIRDAMVDVMGGKIGSGARHISAVIEGIVTRSLFNDGCITDAKPHRWTGSFHEHDEPKNFYQLLEGALRDPRSRIGRLIDYPPAEEIFHVSEMIRNPLAHGAATMGTLEDHKVLFFVLILLYHDIVNPHAYSANFKYRRWINRKQIDLRLSGEEPSPEKIEQLAADSGLDVNEVRINYPSQD